MKRFKIGAVIAAICMLAAALFAGCTTSEASAIGRRWDVKLPGGLKTVYHEDSFGWFGDGNSYTVFTGDKMTTARFTAFCDGELKGYAFKSGGAYCARLEEEARETVRRLNVSEEYAPDFSEAYLYSLGKYEPHEEGDFSVLGVLFLWFESSHRLIVLEGRI